MLGYVSKFQCELLHQFMIYWVLSPSTISPHFTSMCLKSGVMTLDAHLRLSYCSKGICHYMCFLWIVLLHISQFSHSVVSESLQPHGLQHTRLPCPSLSPGVCSNSCPLSQWWYLTISSSAALYFCLQSFPASGSFPMSWLFASGGQSIWVTLN